MVADKAIDEVEFNGKTIREWTEIILATDTNVGTKDGTNLAEVGIDCISRQAAIEAVQNRHMMLSKEKVLLINDLEKLPSVQPKRGKWTADNACSECGCQPWFWKDIHNYNFCPNCGADMREVTE